MALEQEQEQPIKRLPNWTVLSNLKRQESTPWIGQSIEFFDEEYWAAECYRRHSQAGDVPTMRPFHHSDEQHLHVLDSRRMESVQAGKTETSYERWLKDQRNWLDPRNPMRERLILRSLAVLVRINASHPDYLSHGERRELHDVSKDLDDALFPGGRPEVYGRPEIG